MLPAGLKLLVFRLSAPAWSGSLLAALVIGLLNCEDAWARAGGGHSFSGGGGRSFGGGHSYSGGGSHSSGSGDGGMLFYLLFQLLRLLVILCIDHPFIGIPLVIGLGFLGYHLWKSFRNSYTGGVIRNGQGALNLLGQNQIVARLRAKDPEFDLNDFLTRVRTAFLTAQKSWCAQDLTPLRPFVCDGIYERWSLQIEEQHDGGWRDRMENLQVRSAVLSDLFTLGATHELTVFLRASAADYRVRLSDGQMLPGESKQEEEFTEYWTFFRRKGAQSHLGRNGLMEGNCPNCGASVGINQSAKCGSCGAFLRSGEFDWVLGEITQESVYQPTRNQAQPGVSELIGRDPFFSPQLLEDRAAVAFWRWQKALRAGDQTPLLGSCLPELASAIGEKLRATPRTCYRNSAIGAVNLLGILSGEESDQALVELVWSGEAVSTTSPASTAPGNSVLYHTLYVFHRAKDAQSAIQRRTGSAHCASCGAPENADSQGRCTYCGNPLNTQKTNWMLGSICASNSEAAHVWLEKLHALPGRSSANTPDGEEESETNARAQAGAQGFSPSSYAVLAWMVKTVTADNEITPDERRQLLAAGKARHIPQTTIENMLHAAQAGTFQAPEPRDKAAAIEWLRGMARLALADGKITQPELELMQTMAEKCGYTQYDLEMLLKKERADLYRQAQDDIRQTRQILREQPRQS